MPRRFSRRRILLACLAVCALAVAVTAFAQDGAATVPAATATVLDSAAGVGGVGVTALLGIQGLAAVNRFNENFSRAVTALEQLNNNGVKVEDVRTHAAAVTGLAVAVREFADNRRGPLNPN